MMKHFFGTFVKEIPLTPPKKMANGALKMSKSLANCQLALTRNGACQRGPMVLLRKSLPCRTLVTIHECRNGSDTPRDSPLEQLRLQRVD